MKRPMNVWWIVLGIVMCVPAMGGYYATSFDTPDAADGWTVVAGTWVLNTQTGEYTCSGTGGKLVVYQGPLAYGIPREELNDYTVNADVTLNGGDTAVVARYTAPDRFYMFRFHAGDEQLQIYSFRGGATKLGDVLVDRAAEITQNQLPYTLSFTVAGNQLTGRLYVQGELWASISLSDATHPTGGFGLRGYAGTSAYGGVRLTSVSGPVYIYPYADGQLNVPQEPTLRWAQAETLAGEPVEVVAYYLYLSSGNPADANVALEATIEPAGGEASYSQLALPQDGTYYWQVEQAVDDGTGAASLPGDPNNLLGPVWRFDTIKSVPIIPVAGQPKDQFVRLGEMGEFVVAPLSQSDTWFQWYRSADDSSATPDDDEAIIGAQEALLRVESSLEHEGYYYCVVSNAGGDATSEAAALVALRRVAHWTLDQAGFSDGQYADETGAHPATPLGADPIFVEGMDGSPMGAVLFSPDDANSPALAGTWDPSEKTGQFTVSLWANWNGPTGGHQRLLAKADTWGDPTVRWFFGNSVANSPEVTLGSTRQNPGPVGTLTHDGQWQHLAATFDGSTAVLYVNGEPVATTGFSQSLGTDSTIVIGAGYPDSRLVFNGALDDIQVFNYALAPEEIVDLIWYPVTQEPACIHPLAAQFDYNQDCNVDLADFAEFAAQWMTTGYYPHRPGQTP